MRFKGLILFLFMSFILVIQVNGEPVTEKQLLSIYIDPGHGGYDGGAETDNGVYEKDLNLSVSIYLRNYLERVGFKVYMTRDTDTDYVHDGRGTKKKRDLETRIEMMNESDSKLFVSIHMNSLPNSRWQGAQTFYDDKFPESKTLATCIQKNLIDVLKNTRRHEKEVRSLYLLKHVNYPGALVEAGFLSNPEEAHLLQQPEYQEKVAFAIYLGIIEYVLFAKDRVPIY